MNQDLGGALRAVIAPTFALLVVLVFIPGRFSLAVRIYALVLCAVTLALALSALRRSYPRARPLRPRRRQQPVSRRPPPSLARIENETALGVAGAFDLHIRLAPRIRAIAAGLLASRRSISAQAAPDTTRNILGTEAWELVRADRPSPDDRLARGLLVSELQRVVESLERV